jgi:AcrR family transcriptional regulator
MMTSNGHDDEHAAARSAAKAARIRWRTRQVLDAATTLMQDTGFHAMSIQALAQEADVSVGLIYQYFGNKEDVLQAVLVDILEAYRQAVPEAIAAAGEDPVERLAAGFGAYCRVVDDHHQATALAYRESRTLTPEGLEQVKDLELATVQPLHDVITEGQVRGVFLPVDAGLITHDLMMLAHSWALKHWHLTPTYTLEEYIESQLAMVLRSLLAPETWPDYAARLKKSQGSRRRRRPAATSTGSG